MNKKLLYILILFICISLLGIIMVQFFWIRNAFQVKEAQFSRSVNDAMGSVVEKIEARENMSFISRNYEGDSIMSIVQTFTRDTTKALKNRLDSLLATNDLNAEAPAAPPSPPRPVRSHPLRSYMHYSYQSSTSPALTASDSLTMEMERLFAEMGRIETDNFSIEWDDQIHRIDSIFEINSNSFYQEPDVQVIDPGPAAQSNVIIATPQGWQQIPNYDYSVSRQTLKTKQPKSHWRGVRERKNQRDNNIQKLDNKARNIRDVIKKMAIELETKPAPIQQRINKKSLQSSLSKSFIDKGIDLPFEFAVITPSGDSNHIPIRSEGFRNEYEPAGHKVSLFPNDLFNKPDQLLVYFPGQKTELLKSVGLLLLGSILFTLIIIVSSATSIVVMIRQKKISDIKTDFINNMTHEFKTPIATISIAADSIANPRVITEPEKIRDLTRIIKEENNRMNTRVEQVLQMSLLDSRDFKLRIVPVDMNHLIARAVEHYRLQIEKREGSLLTHFDAENPVVEADEDHMRNVLLNLLDNANKYSIVRPEIVVSTYNRSGRYFFSVKDRGLGMSSETQRKVFDKFFRVTSGNIHNIKGFGLGLSYVKAIVLAHHGEIQITSEVGKGSTFEIGLPLVPDQNNSLPEWTG